MEFHLYVEVQKVVFHVHCAPKIFFVLFCHGFYAFFKKKFLANLSLIRKFPSYCHWYFTLKFKDAIIYNE